MRPFTQNELLNAWETGLDLTQIERSLHLLSIAYVLPDKREAACLSIGERDAYLLQLRSRLFGSRLVSLDHCPACSEPVEWKTNVSDLGLQSLPESTDNGPYHLKVENLQITFRLPNSLDMAHAASTDTSELDPNRILLDCILSVEDQNREISPDTLSVTILETLSRRMAELDPQANISMLLTCPECRHQWKATFDIMSYLWAEIDSWARRIVQEVYVLARAFSWSEKDILDMSPRRRRIYLDMLRT